MRLVDPLDEGFDLFVAHVAGRTAGLEPLQPGHAVGDVGLAEAADRVVVEEEHLGDLGAGHSLVEQENGVDPAREALKRPSPPEDRLHLRPLLRRQEALVHPPSRIPQTSPVKSHVAL